jgi:hypothetical protein
MLGVLLGLAVFAVLAITGLYKNNSYGSDLEKFISSKNPSSTYDVEKYTKEYEYKQSQRFL